MIEEIKIYPSDYRFVEKLALLLKKVIDCSTPDAAATIIAQMMEPFIQHITVIGLEASIKMIDPETFGKPDGEQDA